MSIERKRIGSYRVLRVLGVGGMGTVYEAEHLQIARRVAIKVLHGEFSHNQELVERFLNEARAVNAVSYTHLDVYKRQRQMRPYADPARSPTAVGIGRRVLPRQDRGYQRAVSASPT